MVLLHGEGRLLKWLIGFMLVIVLVSAGFVVLRARQRQHAYNATGLCRQTVGEGNHAAETICQ